MPIVGQKAAASLFFLLFGGAALFLGRDMPVGTAGEMGVGYVPRMLAVGCLAIGVMLGATALRRRHMREPVAFAGRPTVIVTVLVILFALLLTPLGLPLTIGVVVCAAATSGENFSWPVLVAVAVALAAISTLLFHTLLRLQVPVWPNLAWF